VVEVPASPSDTSCWFRVCTEDRAYALANLERLMVKPVNASGGYRMLMGLASSAAQCYDDADITAHHVIQFMAGLLAP
jgi:uncharacterized circularly permuted ATP-grasp superfamily protein